MSEWFGSRQKQSLVVLLLLLAGILYVSRSRDQDSPEAQVRAAIAEMVEGAEKRSIAPFKKHMSEKIQDEAGRGKDELLDTLRLIFFRHQTISLHLVSLEVADNTNPDIMSADLILLMSETALPTDKGNFFLTFRREGDTWRVWEIQWRDGYGM